jgi:hypothetical protein
MLVKSPNRPEAIVEFDVTAAGIRDVPAARPPTGPIPSPGPKRKDPPTD